MVSLVKNLATVFSHLKHLTAQRCRSEKEKKIEDLFSSVSSQFKKYHPSGNLKFNYLGIFQSLRFRFLMEIKILPISLMLNFTPNTLLWAVTGA